MTTILSVFHEYAIGWHTFTSPQIPGLFLTGPDEDFKALFDALPSTINALIEAGGRRPVQIMLMESYRNNAAGVGQSGMKEILHFAIAEPEIALLERSSSLAR